MGASGSCSQNAGVKKTIYTRQSDCLREVLVNLRRKAGLTQRQLATKLNREHNLIGRLELGERRLDMVEFFWICKACGVNPKTTASELMSKLEIIQSEEKT